MAGQISKITQIGMVTADLDKMVKYYEEMLGGWSMDCCG